jgi:hypothetical protein
MLRQLVMTREGTMDEKWERYAALGGIWFVVLTVVGTFLSGAPPSPTDKADKIFDYFNDNAGALQAMQYLGGLGTIGLLWWFGSLWRRMTRAEDGRPRMAVVALTGLLFAGVFAAVSGAISSVAAMRIEELGPGGAKTFYGLSVVLISTAGFGIVVLLGAVSGLCYRTKYLPQWIMILGWIVALGFLIAALGSATDASAFGFIGLFSFLLWCIWVIGVSVVMFRDTPAVQPV